MDNLELYIKQDTNQAFSINYDYKQSWHHPFNMQGVKPDYVYVKNFLDIRNERNADITIEILRFVLKFNFATTQQIDRHLQAKGFLTSDLSSILDGFLSSRILNMFTLARHPLPEVPADALKCYCLDFGGKHLLTHYGTEDVLDWVSTNAARGTELITKYLITTQFYLALQEAVPETLSYFNSFENFNIGRRDMQVSACFEIMSGHTPRTFILESIRKYDLPSSFQRKAEKFDALYSQKYIERYFRLNPVILLLAENDQEALEAADIFYRNTKNDQFRMLTDERIQNGFHEESFLKYNPEENKVTPVVSSLFLPKSTGGK